MTKPQQWIAGDPWHCCPRCGLNYRFSQTQKEYTGLRVCRQCWEPLHPQEFVRGIPDKRAVRDARPEPPDVFVTIAWGRDEVAEDWPGLYPPGVYHTLFPDGWMEGWFVVPWFSAGGDYLEADNVAGQVYLTEAFFGMNGTVTANFTSEVSPAANATVSLQYQSSDDGVVWSAWTTYTAPFSPGFTNVRFQIFVTMTGSYHLWVDQFNYTVSV